MSFDTDRMPSNTPERREAVLNIPDSMKDLTLATYADRAQRPVPAGVMEWIDEVGTAAQRSLVLYGEPGRGKTGLGIGALRRLARGNVGKTFRWNMNTNPLLLAKIEVGTFEQTHLSPCWFERWPRLLALQGRRNWDEASWFEKLEEDVACLMLDDISVDTGTAFRESFLIRHLEWSEDRLGRMLILTVNEYPAEWGRLYGARTADRLLEERRFKLVEVSGTSLR